MTEEDRDSAEEEAEHELQRPFLDPGQEAPAPSPRADDQLPREGERVADADLACGAVGDPRPPS